jgi:hypothetical protein
MSSSSTGGGLVLLEANAGGERMYSLKVDLESCISSLVLISTKQKSSDAFREEQQHLTSSVVRSALFDTLISKTVALLLMPHYDGSKKKKNEWYYWQITLWRGSLPASDEHIMHAIAVTPHTLSVETHQYGGRSSPPVTAVTLMMRTKTPEPPSPDGIKALIQCYNIQLRVSMLPLRAHL